MPWDRPAPVWWTPWPGCVSRNNNVSEFAQVPALEVENWVAGGE